MYVSESSEKHGKGEGGGGKARSGMGVNAIRQKLVERGKYNAFF